MDVDRLKSGGSVLTQEFFDRQLEKVRGSRLSEGKFYQKLTDIYATAASRPLRVRLKMTSTRAPSPYSRNHITRARLRRGPMHPLCRFRHPISVVVCTTGP